MWSRRFLLFGLASAIVAAALALILFGLLLFGLGSIGVIERDASMLVMFGIPGIIIYPVCWHAVIYRNLSYTPLDTWRLVAFTYGACCLLVIGILSVWYFFQAIIWAKIMILQAGAWWAVSFLLVPLVIAILVFAVAVSFAIPFVATAGPIAFLHRALLLATLGSAARRGDVTRFEEGTTMP
jgi:hypothetical protein